MNLLSGRCTKNLNYLYKLVDTRVSWEEGLSKKKLTYDAAQRPHIDGLAVVSRAKNEFWCSVVP